MTSKFRVQNDLVSMLGSLRREVVEICPGIFHKFNCRDTHIVDRIVERSCNHSNSLDVIRKVLTLVADKHLCEIIYLCLQKEQSIAFSAKWHTNKNKAIVVGFTVAVKVFEPRGDFLIGMYWNLNTYIPDFETRKDRKTINKRIEFILNNPQQE